MYFSRKSRFEPSRSLPKPKNKIAPSLNGLDSGLATPSGKPIYPVKSCPRVALAIQLRDYCLRPKSLMRGILQLQREAKTLEEDQDRHLNGIRVKRTEYGTRDTMQVLICWLKLDNWCPLMAFLMNDLLASQ